MTDELLVKASLEAIVDEVLVHHDDNALPHAVAFAIQTLDQVCPLFENDKL